MEDGSQPTQKRPDKGVIVKKFLALEIKWLQSLSDRIKKETAGGLQTPEGEFWSPDSVYPFPFNYYCHAGEIALVVSRIKPWSVINFDYVCSSETNLTQSWYEDVLSPWSEQYEDRLSTQGFQHGMTPPGATNFGQCANQSPKSALVDKVFLQVEDDTSTTMEEFRQCFGFSSTLTTGSQDSEITYHWVQWPRAWGRFDWAVLCKMPQSHARELGFSIALDIQNRRRTVLQVLVGQISHCKVALNAAGGGYERFIDYRKGKIIWNRIRNESRYWRIVEIVERIAKQFQ